jgi:hypothetical protein
MAAESFGTGEFDEMLGAMGMATPEAEPSTDIGQGFAMALDARAPDTAWAGIQQSISDEGGEESTYEGTTIYYAPPASEEDEGYAAARVGDLILIGPTPMDLHPVIDTAEGRTPAITTLPEFTTAREALPDEFLMFSFSNNAAAISADLGPFAGTLSGLYEAAFSGMTVAADEAGFRMESVTLPAEGETLDPGAANFDSELVSLAPADTVFFTSGADLGATGVLDAIGATALAFAFGMGGASAPPDPDASTEEFIAQQFEAAASLIGINPQTELFQQLSGEYGTWLAVAPEGGNVSGLFASGTTDSEAVANALMQLSFLIQGAAGSDAPLTTREVDGGQVYVIELDPTSGATLEFGVVDDRLVIGSGDAVDRLAGTAEESLLDNEQYQAVMDTLPAERNGSMYIDLERAIPLMQTAAEETEDLGMMGGFEEFPDASESCANYASQEEAQVAYDAAEPDTFDLDQDFDGQVCEDFFTSAETPATTQTNAALEDEAAAVFANLDYSAIKAYGAAAYEEDGLRRSSAILYIAE